MGEIFLSMCQLCKWETTNSKGHKISSYLWWDSSDLHKMDMTWGIVEHGNSLTGWAGKWRHWKSIPVVPVTDGYVIGSSIKSIPIVGKDITLFVQQLMRVGNPFGIKLKGYCACIIPIFEYLWIFVNLFLMFKAFKSSPYYENMA